MTLEAPLRNSVSNLKLVGEGGKGGGGGGRRKGTIQMYLIAEFAGY